MGRVFSIVVLLSGVILLLVVLPFQFIRLFYAPWLEARGRLIVPLTVETSLPPGAELVMLGSLPQRQAFADVFES